jgi:diacylglycerol kinase
MKEELSRLGRSFGYAIAGIGFAIRTQRNFRIHLVALVMVVYFGTLARLSLTHWCLELLCCMLVISLELVNTAVECACDQISAQKHPLLGHAKDAAAGAVLAAAVGSVILALLIFFRGDPEYRSRVLAALGAPQILLLAALALAGIAFIFLPSILQQQHDKERL